jgi:site-specific recombinase XerC
MGKGRRPRACPFGHKSGQALYRYMRVRAAGRRERAVALARQWGRLTETGFERAVKRRRRAAEPPDIPPHQFRHTYAHLWLAAGGTEGGSARAIGCSCY